MFVSNAPVDGDAFFLLADADGGPLPEALYDWAALFISLDGAVERRGDLLVFKVDLSTAEVL